MNLKKNKKGAMQLVFVISIIAGLITILAFSGIINPAIIIGSSGEQVYQPLWSTIECEEQPSPVQTAPHYIDDTRYFPSYTFSCGYDEYVDSCEIYLTCEKQDSIFHPECQVKIGSTVYYIPAQETKFIKTLYSGQTITFDKSSLLRDDRDWTTAYKIYNEYKLRYETGTGYDWIADSDGCSLPYWVQDQVEQESCIEAGRLTKDSCRIANYMDAWVEVVGNVYEYNGQSVVCSMKTLYGIEQVQMVDGSKKYIQGNSIKTVECCPNEPFCTESFRFDKDEEETCTFDYQCLNGGKPIPVDATTYKVGSCEGGTCVYDTINVECVSTEECLRKYGTGWTCDISFNSESFGKCIPNTVPSVCGDGWCDGLEGETIVSCPQDCTCPVGEELVTDVKKVDCAIGFPLYIGCSERITERCEGAKNNAWVKWLFIGLAVVVLFLLRKQIWAGIKKLLSWFGVKI